MFRSEEHEEVRAFDMAQLSPIMTDDEVATLLGVAVRTFRKYVTHGPLNGAIDIRKAEPQKFRNPCTSAPPTARRRP